MLAVFSRTHARTQNQTMADLKADPKILELFMPYTPVVGTPDVPVTPNVAWAAGKTRSMPLMVGNTRQEGVLFVDEARALRVSRGL